MTHIKYKEPIPFPIDMSRVKLRAEVAAHQTIYMLTIDLESTRYKLSGEIEQITSELASVLQSADEGNC